MSYAAAFRRQQLVSEIERLRPMLPDTVATKRNTEAIERWRPLTKMSEAELSTYLDLFVRSYRTESEEMSTESGMVLVPLDVLKQVECKCSVKERYSGHLIDCWYPTFKEALLAAAPASPPTPAVDGWQPIETIPNTDEEFLAGWPDGLPAMIRGAFWHENKDSDLLHCTHWLRLPEIPK